MFAKETYVERRNRLKTTVGHGLLLFLGNEESGMNYEDNTYPYRQDSSFLYFFGLSYAGLAAVIDIDEDKEFIFGDELTIDHIVWMGTQPTLREKSQRVRVNETRPLAELRAYLDKAVAKGQAVHYLPPYRPEHTLKLFRLLDVKPGEEQPSVPFIRTVEAGAHAMFFPCGLGHMMGLDVHDTENLGEVWVGYDGQPKSTQFGRKSLRLARPLEPGFVLTIRPGIYFIPELMDYWGAEKRFADFINYDKLQTYRDFTGLRNEEDYLITETGARCLGKYIPVTTDEVEALR